MGEEAFFDLRRNPNIWRCGFNSRRRIEVSFFSQLLEHGSDRYETLLKRISDDFGRFLFRHRKKKIGEISDQNFCFSPIWRGFGRATAEQMSKSACSSNFALHRLIERPVRPKILGFGENLGFLKNFHSIVGDRFSGGTFSTASYRFKRHYYLTTKSLMLDPTWNSSMASNATLILELNSTGHRTKVALSQYGYSKIPYWLYK